MADKPYPFPTRADDAAIDDCWNRIGNQGDGSCPLLPRHIHCRNCSIYSQAATAILDRFSSLALGGDEAAAPQADPGPGRSYVVFRHADTWFGLPTRLFSEIAERRAIHSLPHRRAGQTLLGLSNVRGRLVPCFSLAALLGEADVAPVDPAAQRLLVIQQQGRPSALLVDAVLGVERIPDAARLATPATLGRPGQPLSEALVDWRDRRIALLDAERLHHLLEQGLS